MKQMSPPTRPLISDRYKPIAVYLNVTHVTIDHSLYIPLSQGQSLWGEGLE